jgi:hypothetical protein
MKIMAVGFRSYGRFLMHRIGILASDHNRQFLDGGSGHVGHRQRWRRADERDDAMVAHRSGLLARYKRTIAAGSSYMTGTMSETHRK